MTPQTAKRVGDAIFILCWIALTITGCVALSILFITSKGHHHMACSDGGVFGSSRDDGRISDGWRLGQAEQVAQELRGLPFNYDTAPHYLGDCKAELDRVTRENCERLKEIETARGDLRDYSLGLRKWWMAHQLADLHREEVEQRAAQRAQTDEERKRLVRQAVAKLTPEEAEAVREAAARREDIK